MHWFIDLTWIYVIRSLNKCWFYTSFDLNKLIRLYCSYHRYGRKWCTKISFFSLMDKLSCFVHKNYSRRLYKRIFKWFWRNAEWRTYCTCVSLVILLENQFETVRSADQLHELNRRNNRQSYNYKYKRFYCLIFRINMQNDDQFRSLNLHLKGQ